jgi:type IX secretion system PorP/SprF family membrane protein
LNHFSLHLPFSKLNFEYIIVRFDLTSPTFTIRFCRSSFRKCAAATWGGLVLSLLITDGRAQDPDFSQFYNLPVLTNPAEAGAYGMPGQEAVSPRLTMVHRNRWPNLSGAFVTSALSLDSYSPTVKGGFGLRVLQDQAGQGTIGTRNVGLSCAVGKRIGRNLKLRLGIDLGYFEKSLDWALLTYYDQIDPNAGFIYASQEVPRGGVARGVDLGSGLLLHSSKWLLGFAGHHLNEPNHSLAGSVSNIPLPMKWTAYGRYSIPIKGFPLSKGSVDPGMRFWRQGEFEQWEAGAQVTSIVGEDASGLKQKAYFGLWYRGFPDRGRHDAILVNAGWESYSYRLTYSWDMTYSALSPSTGGAHEVVLTLFLPGLLPRSAGNLRSQRLDDFCPGCDWNMLNTRQWLPIRPSKWLQNNDMDSIRGN